MSEEIDALIRHQQELRILTEVSERYRKENAALRASSASQDKVVEALKLARSYIGSLTGREVPGMKGLAAVPVLFAIDAALARLTPGKEG